MPIPCLRGQYCRPDSRLYAECRVLAGRDHGTGGSHPRTDPPSCPHAPAQRAPRRLCGSRPAQLPPASESYPSDRSHRRLQRRDHRGERLGVRVAADPNDRAVDLNLKHGADALSIPAQEEHRSRTAQWRRPSYFFALHEALDAFSIVLRMYESVHLSPFLFGNR